MASRLEVHRQSKLTQWVSRLSVGGTCGFIFFAAAVVPNASNERFHKWVGPLAAVCFGAPVLAVVASRCCIDRACDFNDGYNQALKDLSAPTTQNDSIQLQVSPPSKIASPALAQSDAAVRGFPPPDTVSAAADLGDDFAFFDARIG